MVNDVVLHGAGTSQRKVVLRNLKSQRKVRIKIVFAIKVTVFLHGTMESESHTNSFEYRLLIGSGEGPRMAGTDRTNKGIGRNAIRIIAAAAKHLGLGIHLGMDLKTDDGVQLFHLLNYR